MHKKYIQWVAYSQLIINRIAAIDDLDVEESVKSSRANAFPNKLRQGSYQPEKSIKKYTNPRIHELVSEHWNGNCT